MSDPIQVPAQYKPLKPIVMGIDCFIGIIDMIIKLFLYYQFKYMFLDAYCMIYSYSIYIYGFTYIFLPNSIVGKNECMRVISFRAVPATLLIMTNDVGLLFKLLQDDSCEDNHSCMYNIFTHYLPPLMFNIVLCTIIGLDKYYGLSTKDEEDLK